MLMTFLFDLKGMPCVCFIYWPQVARDQCQVTVLTGSFHFLHYQFALIVTVTNALCVMLSICFRRLKLNKCMI